MKEFEHYESLIRREVPAALDRRILAAARQEAKKLRFRRVFRRWSLSGGAARAGGAVVGSRLFLVQPAADDVRAAETQELLALNDWSKVEQENYNLNFELYCGRQAFSELAGLNMMKGN